MIFHEACGHALEATSVAPGMSVFAGKLGQQIAAPCVTAIDDGTMPNEWGSENIDDEGTPTTRLVLIENGILRNYMVDRLNGRKMGMAPTGSARRENYTYAPTSRMRNTFIAPGHDDEDEMIRTMGDGLYAAQSQSGDGRIQLCRAGGLPRARRQDRLPGARRVPHRQGRTDFNAH